MQHENSQSKRALRTALFILLMSVMGMTNAKAQDSHEYVDLGLPSGLLWATCTVGANVPEEYGDYFAWGETQPKDTYNWSTYQYCMGNYNTLTKYCNKANYGYNGFTDTLTVLLPEDDAATTNWGDGWRMATLEEWQELLNNTTNTWTTQNGVNGRLFTATNGNSLFLPAAGVCSGSSLNDAGIWGYYWSSSLCPGDQSTAETIAIRSLNAYWGNSNRKAGRSVRPVRENLTFVTINATANPAEGGEVNGGGAYPEGADCTLTATANEGYTFVNWTESGQEVSTDATYSFTVTSNRTLVANFTANSVDYHWTVNPNLFASNMLAIGVIQIDGVEQATTALELGAFCGDVCRGRERLVYEPNLDRYMLYMTLYGENGDMFNFRLYDHAIGEEVDKTCLATFAFVSDGLVGTIIDPFVFNFSGMITQETHFAQGWTWWSTYIEQNGDDGLTQMETGLGENGFIIKGQASGSVTYMAGGWYGNLSAFNNENSYRVKTTAATDVNIVGNAALPSEHPITLNPGWTWIGFPSQTAMSLAEAMVNFTPVDFDILKSQLGSATYMYGNWYGSLNTLTPGEGLMYKSNSSGNITLTFPNGGAKGELKPNLTPENNHWQPNLSAYPDNMTVIAVVELDDEPEVPEPVEGPTQELGENYELAAFANGECRGSVRLLYVEPLNRYVAFLTVAGDEIAELRFGLYNTETGEEYHNATETLTYESNAVVGNLDEPYTIHFRGNTGLDDLSNRIEVFPNPVKRGQTFNIGMTDAEIGEAQVDVMNALGVIVETRRATSLQAPNAPGVYTLRITVEGKGICYRRLVVE